MKDDHPAYGRLAKVNEFHTKPERGVNFTVLIKKVTCFGCGNVNITDDNRLFVREATRPMTWFVRSGFNWLSRKPINALRGLEAP